MGTAFFVNPTSRSCLQLFFFNLDLGTKLTAMALQTQKYPQLRHLRDSNPMEDVPDQDAAKILEKEFTFYFGYPSKTGYAIAMRGGRWKLSNHMGHLALAH